MRDHRVYLKVKIKSLAAEAKIIRTEERRNKRARAGLAEHRKHTVRDEARHTLLAYGFIRGRRYTEIEPKCHHYPSWDLIWRMVKKYGVQWDEDEDLHSYKKRQAEQEARFEDWKKK
jgi:hypothetical protein